MERCTSYYFQKFESEFYLANMQIIPLGEVAQEETYTDFMRTHEVKVTLDYQITDNWSASVTGISPNRLLTLV